MLLWLSHLSAWAAMGIPSPMMSNTQRPTLTLAALPPSRSFPDRSRKKLISLPDAVYKATALPAQILGLHDRGLLKKGMAADITVFDKEQIVSRSTYLDSRVRPVGIPYVFIGGKLAYCNGRTVDFHSGKVLLHL